MLTGERWHLAQPQAPQAAVGMTVSLVETRAWHAWGHLPIYNCRWTLSAIMGKKNWHRQDTFGVSSLKQWQINDMPCL